METPRITFTDDGLLLRRGLIIDGTDTTAEYLADLIKDHTPEIRKKMDALLLASAEHNPNYRDLIRPVILIARLALSDDDKLSVFTEGTQATEHSTVYTDPKHIKEHYRHYWEVIEQTTSFLPEIHEHRLTMQHDGVWLGVRSVKKH